MNQILKLQILKPIDSTWKEFGDVLYNLQKDTSNLMNQVIQTIWEYQGFTSEYKKKYDMYPDDKEVLEYSLDGYCYNKFKNTYTKFNTGNMSRTIPNTIDKWKQNKKDIFCGKISIPSFKNTQPIDLHNKSINLIKENGEYFVNLSLISNAYKKEINRKSGQFLVQVIFGNDNSKKAILERILSGEYKISASQISKKNKKWFINLSYKFEVQKLNLNESKIVGIDMGIVYPVYMAVNDSLDRHRIEGGEIEQFRNQVERRRNEIKRQRAYCGEGSRGHGRNVRMRPLEVTREKISNFRDTTNHKYSKSVIDFAIKHGCGTIKMECLEGISQESAFLKRWSYFDLQTKIKYKAERVGIKVLFVNPRYTSQKCSKCGHIDSENRPKQAIFECVSCGHKSNADYNAALNIAKSEEIVK